MRFRPAFYAVCCMLYACGNSRRSVSSDLQADVNAISVTEWRPVGPFGAAAPMATDMGMTPAGTGRFECIDIHPRNDEEILIGHATAGLFKTTDGGKTWEQKLNFDFATGIFDIIRFRKDSKHLIACSATDMGAGKQYGYGLVESFDGGESWQRNSLQYNPSEYNEKQQRGIVIADSKDEKNLVSISGHAIYNSKDGGLQWTIVHETKQQLLSIKKDPFSDNRLIVTGNVFIVSEDAGATWKDYTRELCSAYGNVPSDQMRFEVVFSKQNPGKIYVAVSHNKGCVIETQTTDISKFKLVSQSKFTGNIYHMDAEVIQDTKSDKEWLLIGSTRMNISDNGGKDFKEITSPVATAGNFAHDDVNDILVNNNGNLYIATDGGLSFSMDNGNSWSSLTDYSNLNGAMVFGFDINKNGLLMAGTQDMGIVKWQSGQWGTLPLYGDGGRAVALKDSMAFAFGYAKMCFITNDGGTTSQYHHAGNEVNFFEFRMQYCAATASLFIANNHLYRKTGNKAYELLTGRLNTERPIGALWVNPENNDEIWIAKKDATWGGPLYSKLIYTNDGGKYWEDKTSLLPILKWREITDIDVNSQGDIAITMNGFDSDKSERNKVFVSKDQGKSFTNMSIGLPNLPVYTIEWVKGQWVCGTASGVFVADRTGEWQPFMQGLPATIVSELYYHPEDGCLYASTLGRGIWRIGITQ